MHVHRKNIKEVFGDKASILLPPALAPWPESSSPKYPHGSLSTALGLHAEVTVSVRLSLGHPAKCANPTLTILPCLIFPLTIFPSQMCYVLYILLIYLFIVCPFH